MTTVSGFERNAALRATRNIATIARKLIEHVQQYQDRQILMFAPDDEMYLENEYVKWQAIAGWMLNDLSFISPLPGASHGKLAYVFMESTNGWLYLVDEQRNFLEPLFVTYSTQQDFAESALMRAELPQPLMNALVSSALLTFQKVYLRTHRTIKDIVDR